MNKLTIFGDNSFTREIQAAIKLLVTGQTPSAEVRERTIRGGANAKYVNTYYMTRQASLLTGWRWSSECIKEKFRPDESNPVEVGAYMRVTLYDQDGNSFSHESWGTNGVPRWKSDGKSEDGTPHKAGDIISLFDALKGAYSDGIKKALSYFGIANDVYGGKDMSENYFAENEGNGSVVKFDTPEARNMFDAFVRSKNVRYDIILKLLNAQSLNDVTDWSAAYNTVKNWIEGGRKPV